MKVINYSDFRRNLARDLNAVTEDQQVVIVSMPKGKNVVILDLDEYNAIQETIYLSSTGANRTRLEESIHEMGSGKSSKHDLV